MTVQLVLLTGAKNDKAIPLSPGEFIVGRKKGCQIRLGDARVSRRHCRITVDQRRAVVEDLDSANGTLVNGQAVKQAELHLGDELTVGGFVFKVASAAGEVADAEVAVLPGAPVGPAAGGPESIADVMAAMALAESEGDEPHKDLPIELALGAAPEAATSDAVDLAEEDADEGIVNIQWEPPDEEPKQD